MKPSHVQHSVIQAHLPCDASSDQNRSNVHTPAIYCSDSCTVCDVIRIAASQLRRDLRRQFERNRIRLQRSRGPGGATSRRRSISRDASSYARDATSASTLRIAFQRLDEGLDNHGGGGGSTLRRSRRGSRQCPGRVSYADFERVLRDAGLEDLTEYDVAETIAGLHLDRGGDGVAYEPFLDFVQDKEDTDFKLGGTGGSATFHRRGPLASGGRGRRGIYGDDLGSDGSENGRYGRGRRSRDEARDRRIRGSADGADLPDYMMARIPGLSTHTAASLQEDSGDSDAGRHGRRGGRRFSHRSSSDLDSDDSGDLHPRRHRSRSSGRHRPPMSRSRRSLRESSHRGYGDGPSARWEELQAANTLSEGFWKRVHRLERRVRQEVKDRASSIRGGFDIRAAFAFFDLRHQKEISLGMSCSESQCPPVCPVCAETHQPSPSAHHIHFQCILAATRTHVEHVS